MLDKKNLGRIIKEKRKELKLTQDQLADVTDLSRNYISDLENGRYAPSLETVTRIAIQLGIDLNVVKMTEIQCVK